VDTGNGPYRQAMATDKIMKILYHHRTASKDGQAVHIEEMIDAMRSLGHEVRVVAQVAWTPGWTQNRPSLTFVTT